MSKKILNEFYRGEISDLKRYLQMPKEEQEFEILMQMQKNIYHLIYDPEYLGEINVGKMQINRTLANTYSKDVSKYGKEQALKNLKRYFPDVYKDLVAYLRRYTENPLGSPLPDESVANAPTFLFMDYIGDVKNKWLLHFTQGKDRAQKIYNQGFRKGVQDKKRLGLTTWLTDKDKSSTNTYNFAFDPDDLRHDSQLMSDLTKRRIYGEQCIMFRASGIKVFHNADNQIQVIFNSEQASDFVWIRNLWEPLGDRDENRYTVHNKLDEEIYSTDRFMKAVNWVENNYDQYKNVL